MRQALSALSRPIAQRAYHTGKRYSHKRLVIAPPFALAVLVAVVQKEIVVGGIARLFECIGIGVVGIAVYLAWVAELRILDASVAVSARCVHARHSHHLGLCFVHVDVADAVREAARILPHCKEQAVGVLLVGVSGNFVAV